MYPRGKRVKHKVDGRTGFFKTGMPIVPLHVPENWEGPRFEICWDYGDSESVLLKNLKLL